MSIIVTAASKHGSTAEIANAIADELRTNGLDVRVQDITANVDFGGVEAVIIGSAVYMGKWMSEAQRFVEMHSAELKGRQVWLFSSGPTEEEQKPNAGEPRHLADLMDESGAIQHQIFLGKLDATTMGPFERFVLKVVHAPQGDYRNWDYIRRWADEIADSLATARVAQS
jgi:menaquinone-dependent protoporphyrinogen oxidase